MIARRWKEALNEFVRELRGQYGSRLAGVVLYGSRARGDAEDESDIDTVVLLSPSDAFWTEFDVISPIADRISLEYDVVISAVPADSREFRKAESPLFRNIHREGIHVE